MHVLIFSRLFRLAIINIQDLTTITIPSFCLREKNQERATPRDTALGLGKSCPTPAYAELGLSKEPHNHHHLHSPLTPADLWTCQEGE